MFNKIIEKMLFYPFKYKFRLNNKHNHVNPLNRFPITNVNIGNMSYGMIEVLLWNKTEKLNIGNFVSMGNNVKFILGGNHNYKYLSTYPFKSVGLNKPVIEAESKGNIDIKDDVWIGVNTIILSGVTIGQGAVIGTGSVVAKNIPPYAIAVGNPAKVIKYRFNDITIKKLLNVDYSKFNLDYINNNLDYLYKEVDENIINKFINK